MKLTSKERVSLYLVVAIVAIVVLMESVSAVGCNTTQQYPANVSNWWNSSFSFGFTPNCTEPLSITCDLFINGTAYGSKSVSNATATYITANHSIAVGNHSWYVQCRNVLYSNSSNTSLFYVKVVCDGALNATTGRPSGHYCNYSSFAATSGSTTDKIDYLNATHFVFADTTGMGLRSLTTGAAGGGCAVASALRGLNCKDGTNTCYYSTTTDLRKVDMSTCAVTIYPSFPAGGYTLTGGLGDDSETAFPVVATVGTTKLSILGFNGTHTTLTSYDYYPASGVTTVTMNGVYTSAAGDYIMEIDYSDYGSATDGCKQIFIDEYPTMQNGTSSFYACNGNQGFRNAFFVNNGVLYGMGASYVALYDLTVTAGAAPSCGVDAICGTVKDCANQTGLFNVSVTVWQHNATDEFTFQNYTDANGYFEISGIHEGITAQILYASPGYSSETTETVLSGDSYGFDGTTCLVLEGVGPIVAETTFQIASNSTNTTNTVVAYSDWRPNVTYMKNSLITSIPVYVKDSASNEPLTGLDFNSSTITTSCSYAIAPTGYSVFELGEGRYAILAYIAGAWTDRLFAYCGEGAYFDIHYLAGGVNAKARIDFQGYQMRVSNVQMLADAEYNYSWALAQVQLFYDTGDNKNLPVYNATCTMHLYDLNNANLSGPLTATVNENKVFANFTAFALVPTPSQAYLTLECVAPGFDNYAGVFMVEASTDIMNDSRCWIADASGSELEYVKIGAAIQHWCYFRTALNASLLDLVFHSKNDATNKQRSFHYTYDQNGYYYFSSGVFSDDMGKGLFKWNVIFENTFTRNKDPMISYYEFVKVYTTPPAKISPDYCDGTNCPKILYKGQDYTCKVRTTFESEYTNIVAGIKLNGSETVITLTPTDTIVDAANNVHETSFTLAKVGEKDSYGIRNASSIQCHFELYIDAERLVYGETSTQMLTQYRNSYPADPIGLQGIWSEFATSSDKTGYVLNRLFGIPGAFLSLIQVTDSEGNINPILAVLYMIGFALIAALAIVFMSSRNQGGQGDFHGYQFKRR